MKVIVINGPPESGKDTFVKYVRAFASVEVFNFSTVDRIKQLARHYFGWDGIKDAAGRRLLSDLKDASTRYNNGPFFSVAEQLKDTGPRSICFVHVREPEEIQKFKDYYGRACSTIFIDRLVDTEHGNHADDNVRNFLYDITVDNKNGFYNLRFAAETLAKQWSR